MHFGVIEDQFIFVYQRSIIFIQQIKKMLSQSQIKVLMITGNCNPHLQAMKQMVNNESGKFPGVFRLTDLIAGPEHRDTVSNLDDECNQISRLIICFRIFANLKKCRHAF